MITRREFIKWMGVGALASQVPAEVIDALIKQHHSHEWKDFNPVYEWARGVPYTPSVSNATQGIIKRTGWKKEKNAVIFLIEHSKKIVPPKYRKNLQIRKAFSDDLGRTETIIWYYCPALKGGYLGKNGKWIFDYENGIYVWSKI